MHHSITLNELDEEVHKFQGREPSGRQFGEIVLDSNSNDVIFVNYHTRAIITFSLYFINRPFKGCTGVRTPGTLCSE